MLYIKRILTVHSLNTINLVKPLDYFFNSIKISQNIYIYMCVFVCKYTLGFIKYLLSSIQFHELVFKDNKLQ